MTARRLLGAPWFVCVLTATALLIATSAQQEVKYVKLGGALELLPDLTSVTPPITGILWKHGLNKAAQWDDIFGPEVDYYGPYRGRTDLNIVTAKLLVLDMATRDGGIYSVWINGRQQSKTFRTEFISDVPKPQVVLTKPRETCVPELVCLLVCSVGGDVTGLAVGPVSYRWKKMNGEGEWMASDFVAQQTPQQLTIFDDDEGKTIKTFSCEVKNQVSEMQSEPYENPFYVDPAVPKPVDPAVPKPEDPPAVPRPVDVALLLLMLVLVAVVGLLFAVKTSETLRNKISPAARDRFPEPLKRWLFPPVWWSN